MDALEEVLGGARQERVRREQAELEQAERAAEHLELDNVLQELQGVLSRESAHPATFPCPECGSTVPWEAPRCSRCGVGFLGEEGSCPFCDAMIPPLASHCACGAEVAR